jgi:hypothetical protein
MTEKSTDYLQGAKDWRENGRLDSDKAAARDYRKGAQDERTKQVDDKLRQLG